MAVALAFQQKVWRAQVISVNAALLLQLSLVQSNLKSEKLLSQLEGLENREQLRHAPQPLL